MMKWFKFVISLLPVLICGSCANPSVIQVSPGIYQLAREDHGGIFGNKSALKASVIEEASDFATQKGKVAVPIAAKEHPVGILGDWASYEYTFKVVEPTDPEASVPRILVVEDTKTSPGFRTLGGKDIFYVAKPIR